MKRTMESAVLTPNCKGGAYPAKKEIKAPGFQVAVLSLCTFFPLNRRPKPPGTQETD